MQFNGRLESLRGIAALAVAFTHSIAVYRVDGSPAFWARPIYEQSPGAAFLTIVNAVLNPGAAVILFFILSGFVLAQSLSKAPFTAANITDFYVRRCFRILPMMWLAILACYVLSKSIDHSAPDNQATDWYAYVFEREIHLSDLVRNFFLVDFKDAPVTWTMRVEMLGSAVLPAFALAAMRCTSAQKTLILLALCAMCFFPFTDFRYLVCFFVGALLNDRPAAPRSYGFYSIMSVAGISVFVALRLLPDLIPSPYLTILAVTAGAAALLAGVLGAPATFAFLDRWPLRLLGRVSYSLYLLHPAVLGLCAVAAFQADLEISPVLANLFLFFISVAITVLLSVVTHRFVELHGIALGRKITSWAAARSADRSRIEQLQPHV